LAGPWTVAVADINVGLLFVLAVGSMNGVWDRAAPGGHRNNKYSLLGGLRSSAQMISYEITIGLSLVGVLIRCRGPSP